MRPLAAMIMALGALGLCLVAGCSPCEGERDCLIICDCDGDGVDDSFYAHDCSGGVCIQGYDRDVAKGCEALCDEDPFE